MWSNGSNFAAVTNEKKLMLMISDYATSIIIDPHFPDCPIRNILSRISDRWSMLILLTLDQTEAPLRYSEIQAKIPDISQKMLTVALRNLEATLNLA